MTLLFSLLVGLTVLSAALHLWQWLCARKFPLDIRQPNLPAYPAVTALKPLKGCDAETERCLESWLKQSYPADFQVLFGVASPADPVCDLVRQLLFRWPKIDAQLIFCPDGLGANAKVSTLTQILPHAKHDTVIISDADIRIPVDFVGQVVGPLQNPENGLVHCLYRAANPTTLAMRWEAVAINADFWGQVLQSQSMKPHDFALGAVMAATRPVLESIGGFEALANYLADDYQLGNRIARGGRRVVLSTMVVEGWEAPMTWGQVWRHQVRWARTARFCKPGLYFLSILNNVTFWSLLTFACEPSKAVWILVAVCLGVRVVTALRNQMVFTRSREPLAYAWLIPVKDLLGFFIWALAFLGNHVEWRGKRYRVLRNGELVAAPK